MFWSAFSVQALHSAEHEINCESCLKPFNLLSLLTWMLVGGLLFLHGICAMYCLRQWQVLEPKHVVCLVVLKSNPKFIDQE